MTNYAKTLCLLTTSILLASCSPTYQSREEAFKAKERFIRGGRVIGLSVPTDKEVEMEKSRAKEKGERKCRTAKNKLKNARFRVNTEDARKEIAEWCYNQTFSMNKETLTKRIKQNTEPVMMNRKHPSSFAKNGRQKVMK